MSDDYVPERGDLIWITLEPTVGREQAGRRPFVVLTPQSYNAKTSVLVGVPVTSQEKGYPFEVPITSGKRITGIALADQVRSVDWRARLVDYAEGVSPESLHRIRTIVATLLNLPKAG